PGDAAALAVADALANPLEGGLVVAIPDIPAVDGGDEVDAPPPTPLASAPAQGVWAATPPEEESPKLAEAREAMMQTLMQAGPASGASVELKREAWDESEVPAKPSSLEWPEPPPVTTNGQHVDDEPIALDEDDLQKASAPKVPIPNPPPVPRKGGPPPRAR
ncbi:MAG TPA: hypothetical protein VLT33_13370, partial [Labilithrix sp.]|nr:hypothetical protein [Labilithrix sp.]